jgi:hypothetical protein
MNLTSCFFPARAGGSALRIGISHDESRSRRDATTQIILLVIVLLLLLDLLLILSSSLNLRAPYSSPFLRRVG